MFQAANVTLLTLKQRGLSKGQIIDLSLAFSETDLPQDDDAFLKYCSRVFCPSTALKFPNNWNPSRQFKAPVPDPVIPEYLDLYRSRYRDKISPSADLESHFYDFCLELWTQDCRNSETTVSTFMHNDWMPTDVTINALRNEGLNDDYIELLLMEFKLYWLEKSEKRVAWDSKFKSHALMRYKRKNLHSLNY